MIRREIRAKLAFDGRGRYIILHTKASFSAIPQDNYCTVPNFEMDEYG